MTRELRGRITESRREERVERRNVMWNMMLSEATVLGL